MTIGALEVKISPDTEKDGEQEKKNANFKENRHSYIS